MGDASRDTLRGILIEDVRLRGEDAIWTAQSTGLTQAGRALAFEASVPGVKAASGAGIFTVGLSTSQTVEALMAAGAQLVGADFEDERLWEVIRRMTDK